MNREQYLKELQRYLRRLPKEDYENAMEYFTEYFEDAGEDHEAEVIRELGTPKEAAAELLSALLREKTASTALSSEVAGDADHQNSKTQSRRYRAGDPIPENGKKSSPLSILLIVILSICAAPIAAPLAIAALMLLLAGVIVVLAVILCIFVCSISAVIAGVYSVFTAFHLLPASVSGFLVIAGAGLLSTGFGILFFVAGAFFCRWLVVALARFIQKRIDKRREKR